MRLAKVNSTYQRNSIFMIQEAKTLFSAPGSSYKIARIADASSTTLFFTRSLFTAFTQKLVSKAFSALGVLLHNCLSPLNRLPTSL